MEIVNTRKRFKKRVELERLILSTINSTLPADAPLYGLSESAIKTWHSNIQVDFKDELCKRIQSLSKNLMAFCDNSRNTFDFDKRINAAKLTNEIENLKSYLAQQVNSYS
jgi:hypothetical protein